MHTIARPILLRAARRPADKLRHLKFQLSSFLTGNSKVARGQRCSSTSTSSWRQPLSLRFTDLQEEENTPSLRSILQAYPIDGLGRGPAWIRRLEHFLPTSLRDPAFEEVAIEPAIEPERNPLYVRRGLLQILTAAQKFDGLDILSHLGLKQQRWNVVAWVVKEVAQGHRRFNTLTDDIRATGIQWPEYRSLDELTNKPFSEPSFLPTRKMSFNFSRSTRYVADPRLPDKRLQHSGLGQIWRTMGNLILEASARPADEARTIMSQVLSMMATLHHGDIVPEAVYKHVREQPYTLQQPPILHMFSSRILTALSEAAWNAQQNFSAVTGVKAPRESFFAPQLPGTRYNSQVEALSPEVWLELVLWSCLHGGWITDGAAVLEKMQSYTGSNAWSLVCWSHALQTAPRDTRSSDTFNWKDLMDILEGAGPQVHHGPNDHSNIARTISSESVAAYVDALSNSIYTGVGERGISAKAVITQLKQLKHMLDQQKLGLGYVTWEAIAQRLADSNGILVQRDPALMLEILELVQPYGTELESNVPATKNAYDYASTPYFFEASASPLGLFHKTLQAHADLGGVEGALTSLRALQKYTDQNQRRSIEHFFQELKEKRDSDTSLFEGVGFFSIDYPAFFPHIPVDVLSSLLDLFTEAGIATSAIQLLQTDDLSGPIIPESLHHEPALAPALVRYATAANDKPMLEKVVSTQSTLTKGRRTAIPQPILTALLASQISRHRWDSVHSVLSIALGGDDPTHQKLAHVRWHPSLACYLASELLRIEGRSGSQRTGTNFKPDDFYKASDIFKTLLKGGYGRPNVEIEPLKDGGRETVNSWVMLHSVLGVLSSVNPSWASFCLPLHPRAGNQALTLETFHFNIILQGAVDGYGAHSGQKLCEQWCVDLQNLSAERRLSGGVEKMSPVQPRPSGQDLSDNWSVQVQIPRFSDRTLRFYGRIMPNLTTLRIILRRLFEEKASGQSPPEETLRWIEKMLNGLGYGEHEVVKEILRVTQGVEWRLENGLGRA
jgi:hypothetical protein